MKTKHVNRFNHDSQASTYDTHVKNESDPIRSGYEDALRWVSEKASIGEDLQILELGSGSGNLTTRLKNYRQLVCVDLSKKMTEIAKTKVQGQGNVRFLISDLLVYFENSSDKFDRIVSTYAIHHLTDDEKGILIEKIFKTLETQGQFVCADLMFENNDKKEEIFERYNRENKIELVGEIQDEFFWNLETIEKKARSLGFEVQKHRFSELSWGLVARKL